MSVFLKKGAVVALIDEKSGFLSLQPVGMELKTVFHGNVGLELANEIIVLSIEVRLVGKGGFRFIVHILYVDSRQFYQRLGKNIAREVHTG